MKIPKLNIQGVGQPLIWLHGMLNSVESDSIYSLIDFRKLEDSVSVIRYNACDKSIDGDYSWRAMTDELYGIANSQNYSSVILSGSSMGAGTAINAAVRYPELVKALILVTPAPAWEMRNDVKTVYKKIASRTNPDRIPEFLKRIIQWNQDPPVFFEQIYPGTNQKLYEYRLSFHPQYYSQIYLGGAASDLPPREQIARINVPTLIISVPDDLNHPMEMAHELNKLIINSKLHLISDFEDYLTLQTKIRDFIAEVL